MISKGFKVMSVLMLTWILINLSNAKCMGRPPERSDIVACKAQLFDKLDKIQENEDQFAYVYPYFNRTGFPCKTYCRFISTNPEISKMTDIVDSPQYVMCGKDRYCSKGKCIRYGKSEEKETEHKESVTSKVATNLSTPPTTIGSGGGRAPKPTGRPDKISTEAEKD